MFPLLYNLIGGITLAPDLQSLNTKNDVDLSDITLVCVTYNSSFVIESCIKPLMTVPNIIIVDNASLDNSIERVLALRPDAKIIRNDGNPGWGPAVNQGFAAVETTYALLMNPDATITPEVAGQLKQTAARNENAGIVAPFLYSPNRGLELTMRGPNERNHEKPGCVPEGPVCTWFMTGAVWFCRVSAFRDIGGFDENIWVYCEDLDVCKRLAMNKYAMILLPDARGDHLVSRAQPSTVAIRWRKEWNIVWGHLYLIKKYENTERARTEAWKLIRKHAPKALFYLLIIKQGRFFRDLAVAHAALSYLLGKRPRIRR